MPDKPVLSEEEIDALLGGGGTEADEDDGFDAVQVYDLTNQDHHMHGRFPVLEVVNEKFVRHFRSDLADLVGCPALVGAGGVQTIKYSEYASQLYVPTAMSVVRVEPLPGRALVVVDARLLIRIVDLFFGGGGRAIKIEGRDFTPTELRILDRVLGLITTNLTAAWEIALPIQFEKVGFEENPSHLNLIGDDELVLVNTYQVELESGGGSVHFALPYSMIEKHRGRLDDGVGESSGVVDPAWQRRLRASILESNVALSCAVAERQLAVEDVAGFTAGQVIPMDVPEEHVVYANGAPSFVAKLGNSGNKLAFEVTSVLSPAEEV